MSGGQRQSARQIFDAAIAAVLPGTLIEKHLRLENEALWAGSQCLTLRPRQKIFVFGSGKAAITMARAVEQVLGDRIAGGLVICSYLDPEPLQRIRVLQGSHPVPTEASGAATAALWQAMTALGEDETFLFLLSGGASALLEKPLPPLTLAEMQATTRALLAKSVPIHQINVVRKHLSQVKGGRLGAAIKAAGAVLVISDVIGDDLATIGSAPLYCDNTSFSDAHRVLTEYGLWDEVPANARLIINEGCQGRRPDTPKAPGPRISHHLIGSNFHALEAARQQAEALGLAAHIMTSRLQGEAREVARALIALAKEIQETGSPLKAPVTLLFGGEPTVTVRGSGRGGRNQELALAALLEIGKTTGILLLSGGTDGIDGNSEAAGAVADSIIHQQAMDMGLDPAAYLANNDASTFFSAVDGLITTGPTGTNVMDIIILTIHPKEAP